MRFVITGEWSRNRLLQTIVVLYSVYVAGLWLTNALLYFQKMNLWPSSVVDYYHGNEELFTSPRSYQGMLEVSHFHLFAMGMLLLVLTHLMLFVPLKKPLEGLADRRAVPFGGARRRRRLARALRSPGLRVAEGGGLSRAADEPRAAGRSLALGGLLRLPAQLRRFGWRRRLRPFPGFARALAWGSGLALLWASCATPVLAPQEPVSWTSGQYAMGTLLELQLHGTDESALAEAGARSLAEVARLESLLSRWDPASDISRLNDSPGSAVSLDPEVAALLVRSIRLRDATDGSFDVTVGPLIALWTQAAASDRLPSDVALEAALERVGEGRLAALPNGRVVLASGSRVDLGGIAKGYALDRVRATLGPDVDAALLSFGQSSSWAIGAPPDAPGWRLLARSPDGGFAGVLTLRDQALSVSGSLGQWTEIEGKAYGHVLDPRTGHPLMQRRAGVGGRARCYRCRGALEGRARTRGTTRDRARRRLARRRGATPGRVGRELAHEGLGRRNRLRDGCRSVALGLPAHCPRAAGVLRIGSSHPSERPIQGA